MCLFRSLNTGAGKSNKLNSHNCQKLLYSSVQHFMSLRNVPIRRNKEERGRLSNILREDVFPLC